MPLKRLHIASVILLVLTGGPLLLLITLQVRQAYVQHKAEERLEREALQTLVISPSRLVWEKKGKEIHYEGRLFDVKSIREEEGTIVITGLFDDEETAIKKQLSASGRHLPFLQLLSLSLMAECSHPTAGMPGWDPQKLPYFYPPLQNLHDPYSLVPTPPPLPAAVSA